MLDFVKYIGFDKNIGFLELGKFVDLIVIDGNLLINICDIDKIDYIMINGCLFDVVIMNEVGEKKCEKLYFEEI